MTEPMANVDNFWLCMDDPTNLMVITGFMEFAGPVSPKALADTIEKRLLCFDRFKKRVVRPISGVGTPNWEADPHFDLRSHLRRVALPAPGDRRALQDMVADLTVTPLDPSKPLWQAHLIENYGDGCAIFFRLHHCIADGIALIHVLLSMTDAQPGGDRGAAGAGACRAGAGNARRSSVLGRTVHRLRSAAQGARRLGQVVSRELTEAVSNPFHLVELARQGTGLATDALTVLARLAMLPAHPRNAFRGNLGVRKCVAWTDPIPIGNVKTVGKAVEATLNDVLIATVTGALRRYLQKRADPVNTLDLVVSVPVNIRRRGTEFELGNKFSLVFLSLPVHIEDPVLRLREVKRRMDNLKHSPDAFVGFQILSALGVSPSGISRRAAALFANKTTAVLTNVPGPRQPLYFAGEPVANMMFWVPRIGRVGLGISIFSYNGNVTVGLATDAALVPDPESVLEGFSEDFKYLMGLVRSGRIFDGPLVLHDRYAEGRAKTGDAPSVPESTPKSALNAGEDPAAGIPVGRNGGDDRCRAITAQGTRCRKSAGGESPFCHIHQRAGAGAVRTEEA